MEKRIILILLCVIVYMIFRGGSEPPIVSPAKTEISDTQREKFKQYFKSTAEKTTKDATWTAKDTFTVGVIDDGSNRDEYARYVCQALFRYGFRGHVVSVQVIDVMKRGNRGQWVKLGEARCDELAE